MATTEYTDHSLADVTHTAWLGIIGCGTYRRTIAANVPFAAFLTAWTIGQNNAQLNRPCPCGHCLA